jgi:hypothetical protein
MGFNSALKGLIAVGLAFNRMFVESSWNVMAHGDVQEGK